MASLTQWHEFEQASGDGEGQGSLVCCSHGVPESSMTEHLNNSIAINGLPWWPMVKNALVKQKMWVPSLGWEDPLEKEMAAHDSYHCLGNPMDRGIWQATFYRITKNRTQLSN